MKRLPILLVCLSVSIALPLNAFSQAKVHRSISNDAVEKLLESLELTYQKDVRKDKDAAIMFFDFKRGEHTFRLYNYVNDLWIECTYEKTLKPEDINRWNADAKFSRLVLITTRDKTTLSLESQLDCLGGVTDGMIKHYINRFEDEAKKFAKFAK